MIPKKIKKIYINDVDENGSDMQNREYIDLSQVWHSPKEEPEDIEEYILHYSEYYNNWFINHLVYLIDCCYNSWSEAVEKERIKQWAYLKDLLPNGGGK